MVENNTQQIKTDLVVLGAGPGGYSAAFRAADLGINTVLVEKYADLGGVCLNVGCIPSKALLDLAHSIEKAQEVAAAGISFATPKIDIKKMREFVSKGVISKLTSGLKMMAKLRKVNVVTGYGTFVNKNQLEVTTQNGTTIIEFKHAIIAAGSKPVKLPFIPDDPRIMDSTKALLLEDIPKKLLILGGGIIGLEMATVYHALGSEITVVEMLDGLMGNLDPDLIKLYVTKISKKYQNIYLKTKVTKVDATKDGLYVTFEGTNAPKEPERFDKILVSVGRTPNGKLIGAENANIKVDERGFIAVDKQMRTNIENIFAIGDVVGNPMLAHKAVAEGRLAAEVISGKKHYFEPKVIPSVAYTDPEVAFVGLTEPEAKQQNINYGVGKFPWMASGRAIAQNRTEGMTKVIFNKDTNRIIGAGIVGINAGELISEVALAIEMGCDAEDIALTIHPHPTLSESIALATEVFEGTITDLPPNK